MLRPHDAFIAASNSQNIAFMGSQHFQLFHQIHALSRPSSAYDVNSFMSALGQACPLLGQLRIFCTVSSRKVSRKEGQVADLPNKSSKHGKTNSGCDSGISWHCSPAGAFVEAGWQEWQFLTSY